MAFDDKYDMTEIHAFCKSNIIGTLMFGLCKYKIYSKNDLNYLFYVLFNFKNVA